MLSIVAPVYNESESIACFIDEVARALHELSLPCRYEIVVADDGSTDGTSETLANLVERYPGIVRVVRLTRNFGFCEAASAALHYARGDVVILMDADMQDNPEAFSAFLEKWGEGYDVVYAVRTERHDAQFIRTLTWFFYRALSFMAKIPLPLDAGTFALMDRRAVDALTGLPERNRYIPGLRCWIGFKQIGVPVERRERNHGKSRMGLRRLYDLAIMALFSFSFMPLFIFRFFGVGALVAALIIMLASPALVAVQIVEWPLAGIIFLVAFFSGVNLLGIGILGEYVALIYDEVRRRPLYLVDAILEKPLSPPSENVSGKDNATP